MSVSGKLSTMSLTDLLQWAAINRKAGYLELERNQKTRRIGFRDGQIVSCSSDDPATLLGQFLLSRGKITPRQLQDALAAQQTRKQNLGSLLIEMGAVTQEEIDQAMSDKAEETILGLFDWEEAVFRFEPNRIAGPYTVDVEFTVDELVFHGMQRRDEMEIIRQAFPNSGVVLERTDVRLPDDFEPMAMATKILESLDAEPTVAEILLFSHASEFHVLRCLHDLLEQGVVQVREVREVDPDLTSLLDGPHSDSAEQATPHDLGALLPDGLEVDDPVENEPDPIIDLQAEIEVAERLLGRGEFEATLEVLHACYRAQPGELYIKHLIGRAEAACLESLRGRRLPERAIPTLVRSRDGAEREALSPEANFLVGLIDGETDIRSILWLAPLREVEALRALQQLVDRGWIELREGDTGECVSVAAEASHRTS